MKTHKEVYTFLTKNPEAYSNEELLELADKYEVSTHEMIFERYGTNRVVELLESAKVFAEKYEIPLESVNFGNGAFTFTCPLNLNNKETRERLIDDLIWVVKVKRDNEDHEIKLYKSLKKKYENR